MARVAIPEWTYEELKKEVNGKFTSIEDYKEFARNNSIGDKKAPVSPDLYFKKKGEWVSYPDFLGITKGETSSSMKEGTTVPKAVSNVIKNEESSEKKIALHKTVALNVEKKENTEELPVLEEGLSTPTGETIQVGSVTIEFSFIESEQPCEIVSRTFYPVFNKDRKEGISFHQVDSKNKITVFICNFKLDTAFFKEHAEAFFNTIATGKKVLFTDGSPVRMFELDEENYPEDIQKNIIVDYTTFEITA